MPDSKILVAVAYRGNANKMQFVDRMTRRDYVIEIMDYPEENLLEIEISSMANEGHLKMLCEKFGVKYKGRVEINTEVPGVSAEETEVIGHEAFGSIYDEYEEESEKTDIED